METPLKTKSFRVVFWIMLFFLSGDTLDTFYRFVVIGYFGPGASFPGSVSAIKPNVFDLLFFLLVQIGIVVGIFNLYKLKKIGGYYFLFSNILFLIYSSVVGPISEIGISNIFFPVFFYFFLYVFFAVCVPWFYSERFK